MDLVVVALVGPLERAVFAVECHPEVGLEFRRDALGEELGRGRPDDVLGRESDSFEFLPAGERVGQVLVEGEHAAAGEVVNERPVDGVSYPVGQQRVLRGADPLSDVVGDADLDRVDGHVRRPLAGEQYKGEVGSLLFDGLVEPQAVQLTDRRSSAPSSRLLAVRRNFPSPIWISIISVFARYDKSVAGGPDTRSLHRRRRTRGISPAGGA